MGRSPARPGSHDSCGRGSDTRASLFPRRVGRRQADPRAPRRSACARAGRGGVPVLGDAGPWGAPVCGRSRVRRPGRVARLNAANRDAPGRHRVVVSTPEHRIDFWGCSGNGVITPRGVAQLGSARRSGRRGRRFKSCHPDSHGPGSNRNQGRSASPGAVPPRAVLVFRSAVFAPNSRLGLGTTRTGPRQGFPRREPVPVVPVHAEPAQREPGCVPARARQRRQPLPYATATPGRTRRPSACIPATTSSAWCR